MASVNNLSTDITALIQEYYERKSLRERIFENGLLKYAKRADIPRNNSKVAHFHRWQKFALAEIVAENADPSTGISANVDEVIAQMQIMASFINIPQDGDDIRIDSLTKQSYPKFVEQLERTANRKAILATEIGGTQVGGSASFSAAQVLYANGKPSFAALNASDQLSNKDIQRAVAFLEQQGAPKIKGSYVCLLNPWSKQDLMQSDADFRGLIKYQNLKALEKNDIPMWAGANIDWQDEPMRETLGGTEGTYVGGGQVNTTYVFGAEAIGVTQLMGKTGLKPRFKVQDITTSGAKMTIGWRTWFAFVVLNSNWIVRVKSVATDNSVASDTTSVS